MACAACSSGAASAASSASASSTALAKTSSTTKAATCPNPFIPSCETKEALAQCLKQVVCDVLRCLGEAVKASAPPPSNAPTLKDCLRTAVVSFAECLPDAICGPVGALPPVTDLPCDFAVEADLSVNPPS
jgi:hypothetical protein